MPLPYDDGHQPMARLTPKQREIRQRGGAILDAARRILEDEGYYALTMNRLAQEVSRSKPTVYEHFASKEDVLMGLAIEDAIQRWVLYERAATFDGRPRERLTAIGEFGSRVFADHLRIYEFIQPNAVRAKASERQQRLLFENEWKSHRVMSAVIEDGMQCGDLELPSAMKPTNVAYAIYCIALGGYLTELRGVREEGTGVPNTMETVQWTLLSFLDGIGWRPLSGAWDYGETIQRVHRQLDVPAIILESKGLARRLRREQERSFEADSEKSAESG